MIDKLATNSSNDKVRCCLLLRPHANLEGDTLCLRVGHTTPYEHFASAAPNEA